MGRGPIYNRRSPRAKCPSGHAPVSATPSLSAVLPKTLRALFSPPYETSPRYQSPSGNAIVGATPSLSLPPTPSVPSSALRAKPQPVSPFRPGRATGNEPVMPTTGPRKNQDKPRRGGENSFPRDPYPFFRQLISAGDYKICMSHACPLFSRNHSLPINVRSNKFMHGIYKYLAAGVFPIAILFSNAVHAMEIADYDAMTADNRADYNTAIISGTIDSLQDSGDNASAQKLIDAFTKPAQGEKTSAGHIQLFRNLEIARAVNKVNAGKPNWHPLEVEQVFLLTFAKNGVKVPLGDLEALSQKFKPSNSK